MTAVDDYIATFISRVAWIWFVVFIIVIIRTFFRDKPLSKEEIRRWFMKGWVIVSIIFTFIFFVYLINK